VLCNKEADVSFLFSSL